MITIDGVPYDVVSDSAGEEESERGGAENRSVDGTMISTVSWEKRVFDFTLAPLSEAAYNALRAAVAGGVEVEVGGMLVPDMDATVRIRSAAFVASGNNFVVVPRVLIKEA